MHEGIKKQKIFLALVDTGSPQSLKWVHTMRMIGEITIRIKLIYDFLIKI